MHWWTKVAGVFLFAAGLFFFVLPIPIGAIMMTVACLMIFGDNPKLNEKLRKLRVRSSKADWAMNSIARWSPAFLREILQKSCPKSDP